MGCFISSFIDKINVSVYNSETIRLLTYDDTDTLFRYINSYDIMKSFIDYNEKIIHKDNKEYERALIILYKYTLNTDLKQIITFHIETLNIESFYDFHERLEKEKYINIIETNLLFDMNDINAIKSIIMFLKNNDIIFNTTFKKLMKRYEYIQDCYPRKIDYNVYR